MNYICNKLFLTVWLSVLKHQKDKSTDLYYNVSTVYAELPVDCTPAVGDSGSTTIQPYLYS